MNPKRKRELLLQEVESLVHAAERVSLKYGHDEGPGGERKPCDWTEWWDLRAALVQVRHALAREGASVPHLSGHERPRKIGR